MTPKRDELLALLEAEGLDPLDLAIAEALLTKSGERQLKCLTPVEFAQTASDGHWVPYHHLLYINERLLDVACDRVRNLLLSVPPQHGKTMFTSIYWAAWMLGNHPDWRIAIVSYSAEIAEAIGDAVLTLLERWGKELWGIEVSKRRRSAARFDIAGHRGGLVAVGVDGSITGRRVDLLIIDDPFKGRQEACSPTMREQFKTKYIGNMMSRLSKHGRTIVIQTRWHEDDAIGWLLNCMAEGGKKFEYVNLPGRAPYPDEIPEEEHHIFFPDPLGRQPGEALCPELHPAEQLEEFEFADADLFWALYQGRPTPGSGGMFDETWWQFWGWGQIPMLQGPDVHIPQLDEKTGQPVLDAAGNPVLVLAPGAWYYPDPRRRFDRLIQSWDMSFKDTSSSSYVVGAVWGKIGADIFLLDLVRKRMSLDATVEAVREMKRKWPESQEIIIEAKANGPRVIKRLKHEIAGLIPKIPEGSKQERASAQTHHARSGNVYLPPTNLYGWVRPFIRELAGFPKGTYNDQVDNYTQAMEEFEDRGTFTPPTTGRRRVDMGRALHPEAPSLAPRIQGRSPPRALGPPRALAA